MTLYAGVTLRKTADPKKYEVVFDNVPVGIVEKDLIGWKPEEGHLGDVQKTPVLAANHLIDQLRKAGTL